MNEIVEFLDRNFYQPHLNKRFWTSYQDANDILALGWSHLTKEFANRTACHIQIIFGKIEDSTPNLSIQLFTVVDNDWMQVFWGDIRDLDDLKFILDRIGIPYHD